MPRQRITHWFDDEAASRLAAMQTIDPALDFGSGLTLVAFSAAIDDERAKITSYNQQMSIAEEKRTMARAADKGVRRFASRLMSATAARYGKDSEEYVKAGGTRTSEQRRSRKPRPAPENGGGTES